MCVTVEEMNKTMQAIQEWKRVKEEADTNIKPLNEKVIEFLQETKECETVDKKGKPILKYIGTVHKASYSIQEKETPVKEKVIEFLNLPIIKEVIEREKIDTSKLFSKSVYPVLRIN